MSRVVSLVFVALLCLASPARAEESASAESPKANALVVSLGWTTTIFPLQPTSIWMMQGPGVEVGWRRALWTRGALDLRLQWRWLDFGTRVFPGQHQGIVAARLGQQFVEVAPSLWLSGAVSAGYGVWTGCLTTDDCGSHGPALGAALSLGSEAMSGWAVELAVDAQSGLRYGVEYVLLPLARVTIAL